MRTTSDVSKVLTIWAIAVTYLALKSQCVELQAEDFPGRHAHKPLYRRGQDLYAFYLANIQNQTSMPKQLIFRCANQRFSGGFGDRVKGLVSKFVLSMLLDAEFVLDWNFPTPISDHFAMPSARITAEPRETDQALEAGLYNWHADGKGLFHIRDFDFPSAWADSPAVVVDFNGAVWNHLILNSYLYPAAEKYGLQFLSKRQVFEMVMHVFFGQPSPELSKAITRTLKAGAWHGHSHFIGVQMRVGGLWEDNFTYVADTSAVVSCFTSLVLTLSSKAVLRKERPVVFVTSDSMEAFELFCATMHQHGVHVIFSEGEAEHIDKMKGANDMKILVDWYILSLVDILIGSRSGVSETASWYGNVPMMSLTNADTCAFTEEGIKVPIGADPAQT